MGIDITQHEGYVYLLGTLRSIRTITKIVGNSWLEKARRASGSLKFSARTKSSI